MTISALMTGILLSVIANYRLLEQMLGEQEVACDTEYMEWIHIELEADSNEQEQKGLINGKKKEERERGYVQRAIAASVNVLQDLRDALGIDDVSRRFIVLIYFILSLY